MQSAAVHSRAILVLQLILVLVFIFFSSC